MIYLDHNATTPIAPEVLEAMMPYFKAEWGNPSSSYRFGSKLKTVIETAREQVADLIGAQPREVIFTCCATHPSFRRTETGSCHITPAPCSRSCPPWGSTA
jgi:cysteine desulfurase